MSLLAALIILLSPRVGVDTDGPATVGDLIDETFVTRRLTVDETVSLNDWGVVTGDGAGIDPYDLATRLVREGRRSGLKLAAADSQFGPVLHDQTTGRVTILKHGHHGLWARWAGEAAAPPPATDTEWAAIVRLRRYEVAVRTRKDPPAVNATDLILDVPVSARVRLRLGQIPRAEVLASWVSRWSHDAALCTTILTRLRRDGKAELFEELLAKLPEVGPDLWVEAARQAESEGRRDKALSRLRLALKDDPFHVEAARLLRNWRS